ncbi:MAG: NAD-dependent protein deacylase [Eubacteriales bacterium]|nr:NAD-dependent protein deacylase [Eubacteriales bacterium]
MNANLDQIKEVINKSNNIVFFGGAGLGTESNIPDFRSKDGLYNMEYDYPPEQILSYSFFINNPKEFYRFYKNKCLKPMINASPNYAHLALCELEKRGKLKAIVTQNIDSLHQKAGSKKVLELHGTSFNNTCTKCGKKFTIEDVLNDKNDIPLCTCGGIIRPDIVMYEEGLNNQVVNESINYISNAKTLIICGTSLVVYPAASFVNFYKGNELILINKDEVPHEENINYVYHGKAGEVFKEIVEI